MIIKWQLKPKRNVTILGKKVINHNDMLLKNMELKNKII